MTDPQLLYMAIGLALAIRKAWFLLMALIGLGTREQTRQLYELKMMVKYSVIVSPKWAFIFAIFFTSMCFAFTIIAWPVVLLSKLCKRKET